MAAFPNLYYKRAAATSKACYICYKPTATVLATIDTADFLYACPVHLTDRGFATRAPDPEPDHKKFTVSPEEIAKVKQEWEEKQRQEKDKESGKEGGQSNGDGEKGKEGKEAAGGKKAEGNREKKPESAPGVSPSAQSTSSSTHERYVLHRDIFALRAAIHRRRRQAAQTKELAPRLPGAPRGALS